MRTPVLTALAATPLVLLSACGSSGSTTATAPSGGTTSPSSSSGGGGAAGLHVATTSLGKVLVDVNGRTVYMLSADSAGHSTCSAACLVYWPAVAPGHASSTVTGKVASTATTTGGRIATVGGWPVHTFVKDQKPGDVNGEGLTDFGGVWYAVSPSGQPVMGASGSTSSAPTTGHGGY